MILYIINTKFHCNINNISIIKSIFSMDEIIFMFIISTLHDVCVTIRNLSCKTLILNSTITA